MTKINLKHQEFLPTGEVLFKKYFLEMGRARSVYKLVDWMLTKKIVNPRTGLPPSAMGVWFRMWRYACDPDTSKQAYEIFNQAMRDEGQFSSWNEWLDELVQKAKCPGMINGKRKYEKFCKFAAESRQ
jgi:hypothetical protein